MATPRERLNELRALQVQQAQTGQIVPQQPAIQQPQVNPRQRLEQLLALKQQQAPTQQPIQPGLPAQPTELERSLQPLTVAGLPPPEQEPTFIGGVVEPAAQLATGIAAEPVAGIAGIVSATFGGAAAGAKTVEEFKKALTFQAGPEGQVNLQALGQGIKPAAELLQSLESGLGQRVLEKTGSPALAALAFTLPSALLELIGVRRVSKVADITAETSRKLKEFKRTERVRPKGFKPDPVTEQGLKQISETVNKGTPEDIAAVVDADPLFYTAADELGINTEPLASFASRNPQFRAVEQGLASVPTSVLDLQSKAFISDVAKRADTLIEQYGGTLDKAQLGKDFKRQSLEEVSNLFDEADKMYSRLRKKLPDNSRFEATGTVNFLTGLIDQGRISSKFSRILNTLKTRTKTTKGRVIVDPATGARRSTGTTEKIPPKLGRIDQIRKEIGQAINRGTGPFKDLETGLNKALYAKLSQDMDDIAKNSNVTGAIGISDSAKGLVRQRKQIEDNLVTLLGKDLNQALNVSVAGAIKGLSKGQIDRFRKVIDAIPEGQRAGVVLSAMNDVFRGAGVGQQQLNPTQFTKWFQNINRSPAVKKELFKALPQGSPRAIENLFKVTSGISRALGDRIPTGRLNAMFNPDTGFIRRMVGKVAPSVVAFATGSPVVSAMTSATVNFLNQSTDGARRAADLMGSPQFQSIIRQAVKEGVVEGNEASRKLKQSVSVLEKTKPYRDWVAEIGSLDKRATGTGVLLDYLFRQDFDEEENQ